MLYKTLLKIKVLLNRSYIMSNFFKNELSLIALYSTFMPIYVQIMIFWITLIFLISLKKLGFTIN